jgi:FAD/FMN-containing dehydrogenase
VFVFHYRNVIIKPLCVQDLFFALRGGGGGTFGVVLAATTRADPKVTMQAVLVQFPAGMVDKNHANGDGDESNDPLALTRSFWSLLVTHALRWVHEGWGAYVNANSALYLTPALGKEAAGESMQELVEWGMKLKAGAGEEEGKGVLVIQGEYDSWGHCYNTFADANSAVSPFVQKDAIRIWARCHRIFC